MGHMYFDCCMSVYRFLIGFHSINLGNSQPWLMHWQNRGVDPPDHKSLESGPSRF